MFFVSTFAPPPQLEVHAREHTQLPGTSVQASGHSLHPLGTIEAIQIPLAAPDGILPAYILRLHLDSDSNLKEVIRYWGRGGREKLIAPLLNSIARVPGGSAINISYLLPTFARLRVYTYPLDWEVDRADQQDCVFSALNFFNDLPDTNLFNRAEQARALHADYVPVHDELVLGDLVTLVNADKEIFHACVYITEGFVFTKNGTNPAQPWVLMKVADMLSMYEALEKPKTIVYLRRKSLNVASSH